MQVGKEFIGGAGYIALRKQRIATGGFVGIFYDHIASLRGKRFQLMNGLSGAIQITRSGVGAGAFSPDGTE
jgi:hypothetical protein